MGEEYGVEASIGGQEAIATLLFQAIGADGALLQTIPMVLEETSVAGNNHDFIGLMTVPSQPFSVRAQRRRCVGAALHAPVASDQSGR